MATQKSLHTAQTFSGRAEATTQENRRGKWWWEQGRGHSGGTGKKKTAITGRLKHHAEIGGISAVPLTSARPAVRVFCAPPPPKNVCSEPLAMKSLPLFSFSGAQSVFAFGLGSRTFHSRVPATAAAQGATQ